MLLDYSVEEGSIVYLITCLLSGASVDLTVRDDACGFFLVFWAELGAFEFWPVTGGTLLSTRWFYFRCFEGCKVFSCTVSDSIAVVY